LTPCDAIVIGSGSNGLCAAIALAQEGWSVSVVEGSSTIGGSVRSAALTLPGFVHDICSAVYPLALASPFMTTLPLGDHGLEFVHPIAPFAHPKDDGTAVVCERSIDATCDQLGPDADSYRRMMAPIVRDWDELVPTLLSPPSLPAHPIKFARFAMRAIRSARSLADSSFCGARARALFAGAAAHSILPFSYLGTAGYGLVLAASAHAVGWPIVRGGSQRLADALASYLIRLGGRVQVGSAVRHIDDLPHVRAILSDLTPRQLLQVAGNRLSTGYARRLRRFRYGPGVFKMDWAISAPIPWRAPACARSATVHLGGTFEQIAEAEAGCWRGLHAERPFVLLVQPSLFDSTRAPPGQHTAWGYCHVPNGSSVDMTDRIEQQIERFAPGFRDVVLDRSTMNCAAMERHNPNLIGGDITGGAQTFGQIIARPRLFGSPYCTSLKGLYLCSSSTPPGAGVHGMCGYHAAQACLGET
jgi:phytoene dehydrogenase-like protein